MNYLDFDNIGVEELLTDETMRLYLTKSCNTALVAHQLVDPTLMGLDLNEVSEMDMETLISDVLQAQSLVMTEQADFVAMEEFIQAKRNQPQFPEYSIPAERSEGEKLISISFDKSMVEASIVIHQPEEGQHGPSGQDIRNALARSHIVYGIKDDYIERLIQNPIYNRKVKIAQGKAPQTGTDGKIIYNFTPIFDLAPTIDDRGIADYKALNYAQNVKKGDLLCDIVQSTMGVSGISVCGEVITGSHGKSSGLVCGVNTVLSDDKTKLYASCDGQAFLRGRTVYVGRILAVDNVDASTGNILFVGSVHVRGDVASGFSVRAGGNITVDGVAENAVLVSGNNIVICGGVKGRGKDIVSADGSIRALYIENARVQAKGNIYADSILNSHVESLCSINLSGRNGKIIGGLCTAGETIHARQIGNDANLPTSIIVRNPDTFGKQKAQNMLTIAKYKEAAARLTDVAAFAAVSHLDIAPPEVMICRAVVTKMRLERAITALELQNAEPCDYHKLRRCVDVSETIFPNVCFTIDGAVHKNETQKPGCTVSKVNGKVVFRTY